MIKNNVSIKYQVSLFLACALLLFSMSVQAGLFQQGVTSFSVVAGSGRAFDDNYTILGFGLGYYVLDGLEVGLDAQSWMGGEPSINKLSPQVQYVFVNNTQLKPYIGAFFRRTSIDGFDDLDSSGSRLGLFFTSQAGHYLGVGYVYESYLDCNASVFVSCSDSYPEITLRFVLR